MKASSHKSPEDESRQKAIRTLLVDDSPLMLKILATILARDDAVAVVGAAANGRQALQYASTLEPDLILMDFNMPHLNGAEATQRIKQFVNPPIVFMVTSDDTSSSRMMSEAAGADAFIVKTGDLYAQLKTKLQDALAAQPVACNLEFTGKANEEQITRNPTAAIAATTRVQGQNSKMADRLVQARPQNEAH